MKSAVVSTKLPALSWIFMSRLCSPVLNDFFFLQKPSFSLEHRVRYFGLVASLSRYRILSKLSSLISYMNVTLLLSTSGSWAKIISGATVSTDSSLILDSSSLPAMSVSVK